MGEGPATADGSSAAGSWYELRVTVDQEAIEAVSEILSRAAPGGVTVEVPFQTEQEGLAASLLPDAPATLRAYVTALDQAAADEAIELTRERLGHLRVFGLRPIGELEVTAVHEEDWAHAWKQHFPVLRVGRRLVIVPTWRDHEAADEDVIIALDPGMAFGTGLHPTTRLCLAGLERWDAEGIVAGASVLDVGAGSGILAITAGLLGADRIEAIDTDPVAVAATGENAARNGVTVVSRQGTLPLDGGSYDLVLANLIATVLIALASELAEAIRPGDGTVGSGGRLLASGIFVDREPEVRQALAGAGLRVRTRQQETDWVVLDLERPAA